MPPATKTFSSSSYCASFLLLRQRSENCGLYYRRDEPLRTEGLGPVTETEVISYQTAAPQPAMPGQATTGPPEDQISDFARVRILNVPKMKALKHIKQELAELNQLQRQAREVHKPGFGDLEIADAEVESRHKDPALKAVGGHEDKGLEDKRITNLDKHETKTTIECEDYIKPPREECDPNALLQLELEHIKVEQDKSKMEEELKKFEGKLDRKYSISEACIRYILLSKLHATWGLAS